MSETKVYSKSKWHYESDRYPKGLPPENAHTHCGFYLAWLLERGLLKDSFIAEYQEAFDRYHAKNISPSQLFSLIGETLDDQMLTKTGCQFTDEYFDDFYLDDFWMEFEDDYETFFHVEDNERNFQAAKSILNEAFNDWKLETNA